MMARSYDGLVLAFQDSQVNRIVSTGVDVHLILSTAHVSCPAGWPADAPGETEGYLAPLVLIFHRARWQGELALGMGRLAESEVRVGGQRLSGLTLPFERVGPVQARLAFANGVVLEIQADALECPLDGQEKFVPSFAC